MAKAKKAPQKKPQTSSQSRGVRIASGIFVVIGLLVVLSMILGSVITQTPQPIPVTPVPIATTVP